MSLLVFIVGFIVYLVSDDPLPTEFFYILALFSIADALWARNFFKR